MKRGKWLLVFFAFILIISICLIIKAENSESSLSSEWRMFGKNLNHTRWDGNNFTIISNLNNVNFSTGGIFSYTSPAVANGYVYIGSRNSNPFMLGVSNVFYQLNASNVSQQVANFTTSMGTSFHSSPAVANGYVYIGSNDNRTYQLNATNVSQQIANFTADDQVRSSPAVANGSVYVASYYTGNQGGVGGTIYQLNATNISQKIANYTTQDMIVGSLAVANNYLYVGGTYNAPVTIYQLNASNVSQKITSTSLDIDFSSPAIFNNSLYVGGHSTAMYQLNASNISQQIANTPIIIVGSSPAVSNGYVYIGSWDKNVYQLNASNISIQVANFTTGWLVTSSPAISKGYVYIGSEDNRTYQLNASNISQQIANYTTGGMIDSSPAVTNNYVYIGSADGYFHQLNASNIGLTNPCFESWSCSSFGECLGGTQTRNCIDLANCGTTAGKPITTQSCSAGSAIQQPTETQTIGSVSSGGSFSVSIRNPNINIRNITINPNRNISNVSITVSKKKNATLPLAFTSGVIYQAFNINLTINNSNLNNVTIEFRVNKTWLSQQNYSYNNIVLYRVPEQNDVWQNLITTSIKEDKDYYYFSAISPGFSTFIIFAGMIECVPDEMRCFNNEVQLCLGNSTWLVTKKCSFSCDNGKCENSPLNPTMIYAGIIIGIATAIIVTFYVLRMKHHRKKRKK